MPHEIQIVRMTTAEQVALTHSVMHQLRPHLDREAYVRAVCDMMASDGYHLVAGIVGDNVVAVAGYRFMTMLYCGRLLYVDDLVTDGSCRSSGYGSALLEWLTAEARTNGCSQLQLISRVTRERAHRFYFRAGLGIECFHFRIGL